MKDIDIEELLRNGKPLVKDDPTFLLETRRRMRDVEGIKDEVDRQRRYGRAVLLITLVIGVLTGILVAVTLILFPMDSIRAFLATWKTYLVPAAAVVITLVLFLALRGRGHSVHFPYTSGRQASGHRR